MKCSCLLIHAATAVAATVVVVVSAQPPYIRQHTRVSMADGVNLATDLYLPANADKACAILVRTPYERAAFEWLAVPLAAAGYAVVLQDVRGTGASDGVLEPFVHERADGLATVRWIAAQPWYQGRIGLWGTSYLTFAGLMIAAERPPEVAAMIAISGWGDADAMLHAGGALQLLVTLGWNLSPQMSGRKTMDWPAVFRTLPVDSIVEKFGGRRDAVSAVAAMFHDPKALKATSMRDSSIDIPTLHITGWNDFLANDALAVYAAMHRGSGAPRQQLIVGPWMHDQIWGTTTTVGGEDFGETAKLGGPRVVELTVRWFDYWLRGRDTGITREPAVRYFSMNENRWRTSDGWPPPGAATREWFLDSSGKANTADGDGRLVPERPARQRTDTFVFDPISPVPTAGGANFHHFPEMLGPRDQRAIETRGDVLVYSSAPLVESLHLAGPIDVELFARTEGTSTDVTAKFVDVRPDGYARIVADGIRRVSASELRAPIMIALGQTAIAIPAGHRLRVEVSSSNFPKYSRNPNTGERPESATRFRKVKQRIDHGGATPSRLRLTIAGSGT